MRRPVLIATLVAAVGGGLLVSGAADGAKKRTKTVRVGDNWFYKSSGVPTLRVRRNTTVVFRWVGTRPHNVRVSRGPRKFESPLQRRSDPNYRAYRKKLKRRGTYTLVCDVHGAADQSMKIRVR